MLFVTSAFYALGHQIGMAEAMRKIRIQLEAPNRDSFPAVRTIARLRQIDEVTLRLDTGGTYLGKVRSRAFHAALESGADYWVTVDDDVEATMPTLRWMLDAVRLSDGVCMVPYLLRSGNADETTVSVTLHRFQIDAARELANGGKVLPALYGGFGLVAMSRHAMVEIAAANAHEKWIDDDGVQKLALFHELLRDAKWWGEDLSFFMRCPTNVKIEVLVTGESCHAGRPLRLENLLAYVTKLNLEPTEPAPETAR